MDYDLGGVPEFETGVTGSREPGFFVVSAAGGERRHTRDGRGSRA